MKKHIVSSILGFTILLTSVIPAVAYTIQPGDTLSEISQSKGISISEIVELNPEITNIHMIYAGQTLNLGSENTDIRKEVKKEQVENKADTVPNQQNDYYEMTVEATAYTAYCKGCSGITATGIDIRSNPNLKVIAVDPKVIPLGSTVWVEGYGTAIAGDTGGAIKGNRIDVFIPSKDNVYEWGRKKVKIRVYN